MNIYGIKWKLIQLRYHRIIKKLNKLRSSFYANKTGFDLDSIKNLPFSEKVIGVLIDSAKESYDEDTHHSFLDAIEEIKSIIINGNIGDIIET